MTHWFLIGQNPRQQENNPCQKRITRFPKIRFTSVNGELETKSFFQWKGHNLQYKNKHFNQSMTNFRTLQIFWILRTNQEVVLAAHKQDVHSLCTLKLRLHLANMLAKQKPHTCAFAKCGHCSQCERAHLVIFVRRCRSLPGRW